jgi:hypothetical protein
MKLVLAFAILGLLQASNLRRVDDYAGHAAELSEAAGLAPIAASSSPEVRVWSQAALVDSTIGWVIRPRTITTYSRQGQVSTLSTPMAADILNAFLALRAYNGQSVSCPAKDGWSLIVEGLDPAGHFAVYSGNPNRCSDRGPTDAWQAYNSLLKVTRDAP